MQKASANLKKMWKKARTLPVIIADPAETCGIFVDADQKIYVQDFHDAVKFGVENPDCVYLEEDHTYIYYWESEKVAIEKLTKYIDENSSKVSLAAPKATAQALTLDEFVKAIEPELARYRNPLQADFQCTKVLNAVREAMDAVGLAYEIKSADIVDDEGEYTGSHDFLVVDGKVVDFTLSQFELPGMPWPVVLKLSDPLIQKHFTEIVPMSVQKEPNEKLAQDLVKKLNLVKK